MQELDQEMISLYQEMGRNQGMNDPLLMTIFAKLYMEPDPVALEDLAQETGYSLASISNKVKFLSSMMPVKRIKKPGSKKLYLYMEKDILNIWQQMLLKKEEHVIRTVKDKLPDIIKEYKIKAKSDNEKAKLKIIQNYYDQILKFETVVIKILEEIKKLK